MSQSPDWYIVKVDSGHCQIVPAPAKESGTYSEEWGPFSSQGEAISKRVGLIRAGKCQPL